MDPFRFTIALPAEADSLSLLRKLSDHVAHLVGLSGAAARQANEELEEVVRERMQMAAGQSPIEVAFERRAGEEHVTVEVAGPRGPGEVNGAKRPGNPDQVEGPVRLRVSWDPRGRR